MRQKKQVPRTSKFLILGATMLVAFGLFGAAMADYGNPMGNSGFGGQMMPGSMGQQMGDPFKQVLRGASVNSLFQKIDQFSNACDSVDFDDFECDDLSTYQDQLGEYQDKIDELQSQMEDAMLNDDRTEAKQIKSEFSALRKEQKTYAKTVLAQFKTSVKKAQDSFKAALKAQREADKAEQDANEQEMKEQFSKMKEQMQQNTAPQNQGTNMPPMFPNPSTFQFMCGSLGRMANAEECNKADAERGTQNGTQSGTQNQQ